MANSQDELGAEDGRDDEGGAEAVVDAPSRADSPAPWGGAPSPGDWMDHADARRGALPASAGDWIDQEDARPGALPALPPDPLDRVQALHAARPTGDWIEQQDQRERVQAHQQRHVVTRSPEWVGDPIDQEEARNEGHLRTAIHKLASRAQADASFAELLATGSRSAIDSEAGMIAEELAALAGTPSAQVLARVGEADMRSDRAPDNQTAGLGGHPLPQFVTHIGLKRHTRWLQQLTGDVDVTQLKDHRQWVTAAPPNPPNVGFYKGAPSFVTTNANNGVFTDTNSADAGTNPLTAIQSGIHSNVFGSDKAHSFTNHNGSISFLLGDCFGLSTGTGVPGPFDVMALSPGALHKDGTLRPFAFFESSARSIAQVGTNPLQPDNGNGLFPLLVRPSTGPNPLRPGNLFDMTDMGPDNAPYSGIAIPGGGTYVAMRVNVAIAPGGGVAPNVSSASILTKFLGGPHNAIDPTTTFQFKRVISQLGWTFGTPGAPGPGNFVVPTSDGLVTASQRFVQQALRWYDSSDMFGGPSQFALSGLADLGSTSGAGYILTFGSGTLRRGQTVYWQYGSNYYDFSTIYLQASPYMFSTDSLGNPRPWEFFFETGLQTQYFSGISSDGIASWSSPEDVAAGGGPPGFPGLQEASAVPVAWDPSVNTPYGIGDFSVAYVPDPTGALSSSGGFWIMMYDQAGSIFFSWALFPWGPWQAPTFVFNKDMGNGVSTTQVGPKGKAFLRGYFPGTTTLNGIDGPRLPGAPAHGATSYNVYGPMIVEKLCTLGANGLTVVWTFCGAEPYYAFLMKTVLGMT